MLRSVLQAIATVAVITVATLMVTAQLVKLDDAISRIIERPASTAER
jgi:cell division protein ZapA (FtsZ GTPase activity inhibitor)